MVMLKEYEGKPLPKHQMSIDAWRSIKEELAITPGDGKGPISHTEILLMGESDFDGALEISRGVIGGRLATAKEVSSLLRDGDAYWIQDPSDQPTIAALIDEGICLSPKQPYRYFKFAIAIDHRD